MLQYSQKVGLELHKVAVKVQYVWECMMTHEDGIEVVYPKCFIDNSISGNRRYFVQNWHIHSGCKAQTTFTNYTENKQENFSEVLSTIFYSQNSSPLLIVMETVCACVL